MPLDDIESSLERVKGDRLVRVHRAKIPAACLSRISARRMAGKEAQGPALRDEEQRYRSYPRPNEAFACWSPGPELHFSPQLPVAYDSHRHSQRGSLSSLNRLPTQAREAVFLPPLRDDSIHQSFQYRREAETSLSRTQYPYEQPSQRTTYLQDTWGEAGIIVEQEVFQRESLSSNPQEQLDYSVGQASSSEMGRRKGPVRYHTQRKPSNKDEFDGPRQFLDPPSPRIIAEQEQELLHLPTNLNSQDQDEISSQVNDVLSRCAFNFFAKYQFPIPLESDKRPVRDPLDREWIEWMYLLKRLAMKRRIPARVLYNNQIKQLVTVLENSLEIRNAAKHQSRPLKDDRNVLQLVSAGTQVAKILKDATAMSLLDRIYVATEQRVQERKEQVRRGFIS